MTHSSVELAQQLVDSAEFSEWLMYWELTAELMNPDGRESKEEETVAKLRGFAAAHNARLVARESR